MTDELENPPAFPHDAVTLYEGGGESSHREAGMTLHDYHASNAMAALISNVDSLEATTERAMDEVKARDGQATAGKVMLQLMENTADMAHGFADAMLKERIK